MTCLRYCFYVNSNGGEKEEEFKDLPIEREREWRHPSEIGRISRLNRHLRIVRFFGWLAIVVGLILLGSEIF